MAHLVADRLREDGLDTTVPVTSGSKGMQLYAPLPGTQSVMEIRQYARDVAYEIAAANPGLVVAVMKKDLRGGKVLIDWSQNHPAKTTITPYSLRGRDAAARRGAALVGRDRPRPDSSWAPDEVAARLRRARRPVRLRRSDGGTRSPLAAWSAAGKSPRTTEQKDPHGTAEVHRPVPHPRSRAPRSPPSSRSVWTP